VAGQNERRIPWGNQYARVLLHVQEVFWSIVSAFPRDDAGSPQPVVAPLPVLA